MYSVYRDYIKGIKGKGLLISRRCRIVAVYASVGDEMYGGYESGGGSGDGMGGEQRGMQD